MNGRPAIVAKSIVLLAFVPLTAMSVGACSVSASASTSKSITGAKLAPLVQKQLIASNAGVTVKDTTCDDTSKITAGTTTTCHASVNGEKTKLLVTWKNAKGDYSVTTVAG